mmetsp:Transcript_13543/g.21110  ORF Transcript_13543/g.21110 Transcript_13543/m.21110 type:complete len:163 (-) Transcript_13543:16073-16561(-)
MICLKDSHYLKLVHRDKQKSEFPLGEQQVFFGEPPRTIDAMVTLQMEKKLLHSFFAFLNWGQMLADNAEHPEYLGFINKVFTDMRKCFQIVQGTDSHIVHFSVKLLDMKYFLDTASLYLQLKRSRIQADSEYSEPLAFSFQPSKVTYEDLEVAAHVLSDLDE